MKKCIVMILALLFLLCGCQQYSVREGVDFPFDYEEITSVEAYSHASLQKKNVTQELQIQSLYATFRYLQLKTGPIEYRDHAQVSSYRFYLADGTTYELVYEENGVKSGILTTQNMDPHFTSADLSGLWDNLDADAVECTSEELPALMRENPASAAAVQSDDQEAIRQLILDFFDTKQLDFVSVEDHSISEHFTPLTRQNLDILPFARVFRFEKLVRCDIADTILEEAFEVTVSDISVSGDTASAAAVEVYTYLLEDAGGTDSVRTTNYIFSLVKSDGEWKINYIETDNEDIEGLIEGIGDVDAYFK